MEEKRHSHDNSFLTGLALGGIIGAGLALVFSKDEGDELKKSLIKKGKTMLKNLGEIVEENENKEKKVEKEEKGDLKEHWGEEGEKEEASAARKIARRFFHRNGKTLR